MKATLLLSDKTRFEGEAFGSPGVAIGHIACHTGSYMEPMADPAYANQLLLLTAPLTGVCGINTEYCETGRPYLSGLIVRDVCDTPSHWRSAETLDYYLRRHYITAIKGIDTRALMTHIAAKGPSRAAICTTPDFTGWNALHAKLNSHTMRDAYPGAVKKQAVYPAQGTARARVGLIDLGSSYLLTQQLCRCGLEVTLLPPLDDLDYTAYDALVLSHGAREDGHDSVLLDRVRQAIESGKPLLAAGNGFSLLCDLLELPLQPIGFGVHGDDITVLDIAAEHTVPSVHNHRLSLKMQNIAKRDDVTATHCTPNGCCVGFRMLHKPVWGVQFTTPPPIPTLWLDTVFAGER